MYRFIESICFKSGSYQHLDLHQERVEATFENFFPGRKAPKLLQQLPELSGSTKLKVRAHYDVENLDIQVSPYQQKEIHQLKVVTDDVIDYSFKYSDRTALNTLYGQKGNADDILIIRKGAVTDSSYANVIFLKDGEWFTPKSRLLNGIKRRFLIDHQLIREENIKLQDIPKYSKIGLINAMLDPGELTLPTSQIIY